MYILTNKNEMNAPPILLELFQSNEARGNKAHNEVPGEQNYRLLSYLI